MRVIKTELPEVCVIEPKVFGDERGFFLESWNRRTFEELGITASFVQDNHSKSVINVVRGLHYQLQHPQGKLVRVIAGEVFDVAVDIRKASPTFAKWVGTTLSAENKRMLWIPPGFAHGFLTRSDTAEVLYKATDYWCAECERTILWNDNDLSVAWPLSREPIVSAKDGNGKRLSEAEIFA